ncbi:MAG TPA: hypothetical protein V6C52_05955 [Coleofasciculaceae cyanobacterium]
MNNVSHKKILFICVLLACLPFSSQGDDPDSGWQAYSPLRLS